MTNFQANAPTTKLRWLTPERAVLVLPIAAGLLVSVLLASLALTPLLVRLQGQREQVEELRRLRDGVPLLRQQLEAELARLEERRQQQDSLLQLVAGTGELDTFLAELNDLADRIGVTITRAEPGEVQTYQPPPKPVEGEEAPPPPAAGGEGTAAKDPLLREGLERRSAKLGVSGSFAGLLRFMRALESLQVFVEISDLVLELPQATANAEEGAAPATPLLDLSLTLSAYGRQAGEPTAAAAATSDAPPAAAASAP
jgi:Tfp pilus assembly protein PilO